MFLIQEGRPLHGRPFSKLKFLQKVLLRLLSPTIAYPQLVHSRSQRAGFNSQERRRAVGTMDPAVAHFQYHTDMVANYFVEIRCYYGAV
jgi:hypothetical protein